MKGLTMPNYIKPSETCCPCGCDFDIKPPVRDLFNKIRERFGSPLIVSGRARCKPYNTTVPGSVPDSRHTYGDALDIWTGGWSEYDKIRLASIATSLGAKGVGVHETFIHIDFRPGLKPVFWRYR